MADRAGRDAWRRSWKSWTPRSSTLPCRTSPARCPPPTTRRRGHSRPIWSPTGSCCRSRGFFANRLGRKRYFLICIAAFGLCSFLCGIAESLPQLILFRLAAGLLRRRIAAEPAGHHPGHVPAVSKRGGGVLHHGRGHHRRPRAGPGARRPGSRTTIPGDGSSSSTFRSRHARPSSRWARWWRTRPGSRTQPKRGIDTIGLGLIALGLGCLQIVMDRGEDDDWFGSSFIIGMSIAAAVGIVRRDRVAAHRQEADREPARHAGSQFRARLLLHLRAGSRSCIRRPCCCRSSRRRC